MGDSIGEEFIISSFHVEMANVANLNHTIPTNPMSPTIYPALSASNIPSSQPSISPTLEPTVFPTPEPTQKPSIVATIQPTDAENSGFLFHSMDVFESSLFVPITTDFSHQSQPTKIIEAEHEETDLDLELETEIIVVKHVSFTTQNPELATIIIAQELDDESSFNLLHFTMVVSVSTLICLSCCGSLLIVCLCKVHWKHIAYKWCI